MMKIILCIFNVGLKFNNFLCIKHCSQRLAGRWDDYSSPVAINDNQFPAACARLQSKDIGAVKLFRIKAAVSTIIGYRIVIDFVSGNRMVKN